MTATEMPALLILDDDQAGCRVLTSVLERAGYRTASAMHPADARALLADRRFALAICDLHLPGEPGESVIAHIQTAYPATAIVVVTGGSDQATAEELLRLGDTATSSSRLPSTSS